jgi:hypothetical protein
MVYNYGLAVVSFRLRTGTVALSLRHTYQLACLSRALSALQQPLCFDLRNGRHYHAVEAPCERATNRQLPAVMQARSKVSCH